MRKMIKNIILIIPIKIHIRQKKIKIVKEKTHKIRYSIKNLKKPHTSSINKKKFMFLKDIYIK